MYQEQKRYVSSSGKQILSFDTTVDGYAVIECGSRKQSTLVLLTKNFEEKKRNVLHGRYVLFADEEYIYTASGYGFSVFDADLNLIGYDSLPGKFEGRHMEELLIHDGVGYIVDDIVRPRYLFRVEIDPPTSPEYVEVLSVFGVHVSLGRQWIDPDANKWVFLQSSSHQNGNHQNVAVTPMTDAEVTEDPQWFGELSEELAVRAGGEIELVTTYTSTFDPDECTGTRIDDVTSTAPRFAAVTVERGEKQYLASVNLDYEPDRTSSEADETQPRVQFDRKAELNGHATVDENDDFVVAVSNGHKPCTLYCYHIESESMLFKQKLDLNNPRDIRFDS